MPPLHSMSFEGSPSPAAPIPIRLEAAQELASPYRQGRVRGQYI